MLPPTGDRDSLTRILMVSSPTANSHSLLDARQLPADGWFRNLDGTYRSILVEFRAELKRFLVRNLLHPEPTRR
jgi:hypothetical protein